MRDGTVQPRKDVIRRLRLARGWTQDELSEKVGCSKRTIENLEAGHPTLITTLAELTQAFGEEVRITDLMVVDREVPIEAPFPSRTAFRGNAPPLAPLMIGREADVTELSQRLCRAAASDRAPTQILTAVRGWPGVGKTTIAKAIAHCDPIAAAFPDGVLWASLGPHPIVETELRAWMRAVSLESSGTARTPAEMSLLLAGYLRDRRVLLIVDDVWQAEQAVPFLVGGRLCAMLVTTRLPSVSAALAPSPEDRYRLDVLDERASMELLATLAPALVAAEQNHCRELVAALEGLPLALQVAGRLLQTEADRGFRARDLLAELRTDTGKLLAATAPSDMSDSNDVSPTVTALLRKSTDRLDPDVRKRFAYLAPFAPRPATFELEDLMAVWKVTEPEARRTTATLVDRGLLEPVSPGLFQIHQVLVQHAKSLLPKRR